MCNDLGTKDSWVFDLPRLISKDNMSHLKGRTNKDDKFAGTKLILKDGYTILNHTKYVN